MRWEWTPHGHPVALDVSYWTGKKTLAVDGKHLPTPQKLTDWSHAFTLDGQPAQVRVAFKDPFNPGAFLEVAGAAIEASSAPRHVPIWIWLFVLASTAILIASRGGMIPGFIAAMGVIGAVVSARSRFSLAVRLALAVASTAAAWGTWFALTGVLSR